MTNPGAQWTARPTNSLRLSVSAVKRSRARKGADARIPAEKPALHDRPRRAVDCAPYQLSAPQRLSR